MTWFCNPVAVLEKIPNSLTYNRHFNALSLVELSREYSVLWNIPGRSFGNKLKRAGKGMQPCITSSFEQLKVSETEFWCFTATLITCTPYLFE